MKRSDAPAERMAFSTPATEIVHEDDVAGPRTWRDGLFDEGENHGPSIGLSKTAGTTMPSRSNPATKVVVFQWPCGTERPGARRSARAGRGGSFWCWPPSRRRR